MGGLPRILFLIRDKLYTFNKTTVSFFSLYDPKTTFESRLEIAWNYALMLPYNNMDVIT